MAGTGAPKDNQYAKKEHPGRTIGLYITGEELDALARVLTEQGKPAGKLDVDRFARQVFKDAVARL